MMKGVCLFLVLTAFGSAISQRKEILAQATEDSASVHGDPACPEKCNCTRLSQNLNNDLRKAVCPVTPSSLHNSIKSLQVRYLCSYISSSHLSFKCCQQQFETKHLLCSFLRGRKRPGLTQV
jgi:hypothetical protein